MAEQLGERKVEEIREETEEDRMKSILERIVPNRHDLMVMAVIALVLGVVFWAGWEMNPTYSCKVWLGDQLRDYYMNSSINFCNGSSPFNLTGIK
jgi:hypothetical protein